MRPTRRDFLRTLSAAAAAWGLEGCLQVDKGQIVPYVRRPPESVPGRADTYATSVEVDGYGVGVLGECHTGHPTKLEGNPLHPASLGALGAAEQARILDLYDRDRLRALLHDGRPAAWDAFLARFGARGDAPWVRRAGEGLCLLLAPTASPLRARLIEELLALYPRASVRFSGGDVARWEAARQAFGEPLEPRYDLTRATRIVSLDADFLADEPNWIRWSRDWAVRRRVHGPDGEMSRTYVVESFVTPTGVAADHRLAVPGNEVVHVGAALLGALAQAGLPVPIAARASLERSAHRAWAEAVARDLVACRGEVAVFVGRRQPVAAHLVGIALNAALGGPVTWAPSPLLGAGTAAFDAAALVDALRGGAVDTLVTLETNPAFELSPDLGWATAAAKARERVHLAYLPDETAESATWLLPALHDFERWGDTRAYDGTAAPVQPLVRPLVAGHTPDGVLAMLAGDRAPDLRDRLARRWGERLEAALPRGVFDDTAAAPAPRRDVDWDAVARALPSPAADAGLVLDLVRDPRTDDGRRAHNVWLRELPEPVTKLVYDNAAVLAPATAARLGVANEDVVEIRRGDAAIRLPVWVLAGQAEGAVAVWTGYGRRAGGALAPQHGVDVSPLRTGREPWIVPGVEVRATGERHALATTQPHRDPHGRPILLRRTLADWRADPQFAVAQNTPPPSLLPNRSDVPRTQQWGMVVDQTLCTGCSACVVACVAENNIPMVGKAQVRLGREMHWLRIDVYDGARGPAFQPMMCVHCEKAPCEYVCPVNATSHSHDGINEMTYNRCVGTRYCSNNCPYKVRRFNWLEWHRGDEDVLRMHANPDVTVRARGVMEKCTYCVQRLRGAEIEARTGGRPIEAVPVTTACAQTCPTGALVFGLVSDPGAEVSKRRAELHAYAVLNEVGTFPRTRHLARIENPNPDLRS